MLAWERRVAEKYHRELRLVHEDDIQEVLPANRDGEIMWHLGAAMIPKDRKYEDYENLIWKNLPRGTKTLPQLIDEAIKSAKDQYLSQSQERHSDDK